MTSSYVLGVGMTRFTKMPDRTIEDVAGDAVLAALADAGADRQDIGAVFCGSVFGGVGLGQRVMRRVGMLGVPIINLENACASSGVAMRDAVAWVESESVEVALVIGVEMLTHRAAGLITSDADGIAEQLGLTLPGLYAARAMHYLREHDATPADLATVAVKNRRNGALNPFAHFQSPVTLEEVLQSPMIAEPLTQFQCCPNVDGAAAVVISSRRTIGAGDPSRAVKIAGWGMRSGNELNVPGAEPQATHLAATEAYTRAGVGPDEIDLAEVHEPFTFAEFEHCEHLGFCESGEGAIYAREGRSAIDGDGVAINPSGGLISRGHPLGASGAAQIVEVATQLRGEAGARQRVGARTALTHIMGGNIPEIDSNACVVHVLTT
ncbi:MAG: thiolase family protein [Acidimicrobiia bacterium]